MEITRKRVYVPVRSWSWLSALLSFIVSSLPKVRVTEESRPHYSGDFGNTTQDMTPYDQMTTAEHDAVAAFWGGHQP